MEFIQKPRSTAHAARMFMEDVKTYVQVGVACLGVLAAIWAGCIAFGNYNVLMAIGNLGAFLFLLYFITVFIAKIFVYMLSAISTATSAGVDKIIDAVISASKTVSGLVLSDWKVTLAVSGTIAGGYMLTKILYKYFGASVPNHDVELDRSTIPLSKAGTSADI
jgi:hypothetical protein